MEFLREKSERDYQFRQEELRIKHKEQENLQNIPQQQLEMLRMMQQQNYAMMLLMSKFVNVRLCPARYTFNSFMWTVQLRL